MIILRLQGLPWSATAKDIRQYFEGLSIPDGGVHIIGGEEGDVFIAFSTDEDARKAMQRQKQPLSGSRIILMLSSKSEMQEVIAESRATAQIRKVDPFASVAAPSPPVQTELRGSSQTREAPVISSSNQIFDRYSQGNIQRRGLSGYPDQASDASSQSYPSSQYGSAYQDNHRFGKDGQVYGQDNQGLARENLNLRQNIQDIEQDNQTFRRERQDTGRESQSFERDSQSFGRDGQGYGQGNENFGRDNQGVGADRQGFSQDEQRFGHDNQGLGQDNRVFGQDSQGFGRDSQSYGRGDQGYRRDEKDFARDIRGFSQENQDARKVGQGFPPESKGFRLDREGFGRDRQDSGRDNHSFERDPQRFGRDDRDIGVGTQRFGMDDQNIMSDDFAQGRQGFKVDDQSPVQENRNFRPDMQAFGLDDHKISRDEKGFERGRFGADSLGFRRENQVFRQESQVFGRETKNLGQDGQGDSFREDYRGSSAGRNATERGDGIMYGQAQSADRFSRNDVPEARDLGRSVHSREREFEQGTIKNQPPFGVPLELKGDSTESKQQSLDVFGNLLDSWQLGEGRKFPQENQRQRALLPSPDMPETTPPQDDYMEEISTSYPPPGPSDEFEADPQMIDADQHSTGIHDRRLPFDNRKGDPQQLFGGFWKPQSRNIDRDTRGGRFNVPKFGDATWVSEGPASASPQSDRDIRSDVPRRGEEYERRGSRPKEENQLSFNRNRPVHSQDQAMSRTNDFDNRNMPHAPAEAATPNPVNVFLGGPLGGLLSTPPGGTPSGPPSGPLGGPPSGPLGGPPSGPLGGPPSGPLGGPPGGPPSGPPGGPLSGPLGGPSVGLPSLSTSGPPPLKEAPISLQGNTGKKAPFFAVHLAGLPFSCTERDVRDFLKGVNITPDGIQLHFDKRGKLTGTANVKVESKQDKDEALRRNKGYMGRRYIDVTHSTLFDWENGMKDSKLQSKRERSKSPARSNKSPIRGTNTCVEVKGISSSTRDDEIKRFFEGMSISSLFFERGKDGSNNAVYVEFAKADDVMKACQKSGSYFGKRTVSVRMISKEIVEAKKKNDARRKTERRSPGKRSPDRRRGSSPRRDRSPGRKGRSPSSKSSSPGRNGPGRRTASPSRRDSRDRESSRSRNRGSTPDKKTGQVKMETLSEKNEEIGPRSRESTSNRSSRTEERKDRLSPNRSERGNGDSKKSELPRQGSSTTLLPDPPSKDRYTYSRPDDKNSQDQHKPDNRSHSSGPQSDTTRGAPVFPRAALGRHPDLQTGTQKSDRESDMGIQKESRFSRREGRESRFGPEKTEFSQRNQEGRPQALLEDRHNAPNMDLRDGSINNRGETKGRPRTGGRWDEEGQRENLPGLMEDQGNRNMGPFDDRHRGLGERKQGLMDDSQMGSFDRRVPFSEGPGRGGPFLEGRGRPFPDGRSGSFPEGRGGRFPDGRGGAFPGGRGGAFPGGQFADKRVGLIQEGRGDLFQERRSGAFSEGQSGPQGDIHGPPKWQEGAGPVNDRHRGHGFRDHRRPAGDGYDIHDHQEGHMDVDQGPRDLFDERYNRDRGMPENSRENMNERKRPGEPWQSGPGENRLGRAPMQDAGKRIGLLDDPEIESSDLPEKRGRFDPKQVAPRGHNHPERRDYSSGERMDRFENEGPRSHISNQQVHKPDEERKEEEKHFNREGRGGRPGPIESGPPGRHGHGQFENQDHRDRENVGEREQPPKQLMPPESEYCCAHVRNMPYQARWPEIAQFFQGLQIIPGGIHIMLGPDGKPMGHCFIEFVDSHQARLCEERRLQTLRDRPLQINACSKAMMIRSLEQAGELPQMTRGPRPPFGPRGPHGPGFQGNVPGPFMGPRGPTFGPRGSRPVAPFRPPFEGQQIREDNPPHQKEPRPSSHTQVGTDSRSQGRPDSRSREQPDSRSQDQPNSHSRDKSDPHSQDRPRSHSRDESLASRKSEASKDQSESDIQKRGSDATKKEDLNTSDTKEEQKKDTPVPGKNPNPTQSPASKPLYDSQKGCVVSATNLPLTITVDAIKDFFKGFDTMKGAVKLDTHETTGKATGQAKIVFISPSEANRAIKERNNRPLNGRIVRLHVV